VPGIFGQVFSAFQSLLSRAFWFGSFLPVALFAALNLLLAPAAFPGAPALQDVVKADWIWMPPVLVGLVVVAYALGPLVPLFRGVLDGRGLPEVVQRALRFRPLKQRRQAEEAVEAASSLASRLVELRQTASLDLQAARARGIAFGTTGAPAAIRKAERAVERVANLLNIGQLQLINAAGAVDRVAAALLLNTSIAGPAADAGLVPRLVALPGRIIDLLLREAVEVVRRLAAALRLNIAIAGPAADPGLAARLVGLHWRINDLLRQAAEAGDQLSQRQLERTREQLRRFPRDVQPTDVGNARARSERYCREMYGVDFNYIWPRLQFVIPDNDAAAQRIEAAKALIDFAVLSLVLTTTLVLVWLPLLASRGRSPWLFLMLAGFGPLLIGFFYQLVVETQISFGDVVQGVVDHSRFELLKKLHVKPPATLADERLIWAWLQAAADGEPINTDVIWTPPP
jgi:hypothetical protein